ncbi:MAG: hypothetical protein JXR64_10695 [Spirochaetales bacterium]|nr:hypothetical protein [Spirochaetales bacterium]
MSDQMVIAVIIKLLTGFLAAVSSLLLWSKTRDIAWLFMVTGVVFLYLGTLFEILLSFGFVSPNILLFGDVDVIAFIFSVVPYIFFSCGLISFLYRLRKY